MTPQSYVRLVVGMFITGVLTACSQSPAQTRANQLQQAIELLRSGDAAACVHPLIIETALSLIGDNVGGSTLLGGPTDQHADVWRRMDASIVTNSATLEAVNPESSRVACRANLDAFVGENLRTAPLFYGAQPTADGTDISVDIITMTAADELFAAAMLSDMIGGVREGRSLPETTPEDDRAWALYEAGPCGDLVGPERTNCWEREYEMQDRRLNTEYAALRTKLGEADEERLRLTQRGWILDRDTTCSDASQGGSGSWVSTSCLAFETARRRILLQDYQP